MLQADLMEGQQVSVEMEARILDQDMVAEGRDICFAEVEAVVVVVLVVQLMHRDIRLEVGIAEQLLEWSPVVVVVVAAAVGTVSVQAKHLTAMKRAQFLMTPN